MNPPTQTTLPKITPTKSLLYWRKSLINGAKCVPAVLTLEADGDLILVDNDSQVFSTQISSVKTKFSAWGTMTLTVDGKKYDFVGMPAPLSPAVSPQLSAEMNETEQAAAKRNQSMTTGGAGLTVGGVGVGIAGRAMNVAGASVAGAAGTVAGAAMGQYVYFSGLKTIKRWESTFVEAGLIAKKRKMRAMIYFIFGIIFVFVLLFLAGLSQR